MELPIVLVYGKPYYWDARLQQLRSKVDFPHTIDFIDVPNKIEIQLSIHLAIDDKEKIDWIINSFLKNS